MAEPLRVLSLGAGVQSTTLLLMAIHGEFESRPDVAIFSDTGWEPPSVYAHLDWLQGISEANGIPVARVQAGNLREDIMRAATQGTRIANPPFFTIGTQTIFDTESFINSDGEEDEEVVGTREIEGKGILRRNCTQDYKIQPIRKRIRQLFKESGASHVEQWYGISWDEIQRVRTSDVKYITNRYPLVERQITRWGCIVWMQERGYPTPPKSSCIGCPYHSDEFWRDMKLNAPEDFADAVVVDVAIRDGLPGVKGRAFMHRSCKPLAEVDFRNAEDRGQLSIFGGEFGDECGGMCGV